MVRIDSVTIGQIGILSIWITGVAFIIAKLFGVITWSWCLVLLPFWGPVALVISLMAILFVSFKGRKN